MIDTHAHIHMKCFDEDRDSVLQRARSSGIQAILEVGVDPQTSQKVVEYCRRYEFLFGAVGIHPHEAAKTQEADWQSIRNLLQEKKVKALGEIGLDYHYDFSPRQKQKELFRRQLNLAKELSKPVLVHIREAFDDGLKIIEEAGPMPQGGVFHCFSGSIDDVHRILSLGFHISFTGMVTFPSFQADEILRTIPLSKLLLETDSPYMTPVPHRGKRNEPAYIMLTAQKISLILGNSIEELIQQTDSNARKLFGLGEG